MWSRIQYFFSKLTKPNPYAGLSRAKSRFRKIRAKFYGDFADAIDDGANPYELFTQRHQRASRRRHPFAPLYAMWRNRARSMNLKDTWNGTIPNEDLLVVGAGEKSELAPTLRFLSKVAIIRDQNRSAIVGAIALPIFLSILMVGVQMGVALGMMPVMVQIMPPEKFPFISRVLYDLCNFILDYWYLIYGIPTLLITVYFVSLPLWTGKTRRAFDRYMPYSIYRDIRSSEFLVSLAALAEAKVSVFDSVSLMCVGSSPWMRSHLMQIRQSLRSDHSITKAIDTGLFSDEIFDRIAEYSQRSNFEKGLSKIGLTTIQEVAELIKQRATIMRHILILIVGFFILFTVASMLAIGQAASNQVAVM